jgi:ferritin-like metal-binding protein YciE
LAEQSSSAEIESLRAEYEKKKQAALGKVQSLEKDIASKAVDNSAGVRKEAAKALAEAVKSLAQRKKTTPISPAADAAPQG